MITCESMVGEPVMAICEVNELNCEYRGGCDWCLCLVRGSYYAKDVMPQFSLALAG